MRYAVTRTSFATGRRQRALDYPAILERWNAGASTKECAAAFGCSEAAIVGVRQKARAEGLYVRYAASRYAPKDRAVRSWASCLTCRRALSSQDRARRNTILVDAECCAWCGRRFDGVLKMPMRVWTWLKDTLATVDVP